MAANRGRRIIGLNVIAGAIIGGSLLATVAPAVATEGEKRNGSSVGAAWDVVHGADLSKLPKNVKVSYLKVTNSTASAIEVRMVSKYDFGKTLSDKTTTVKPGDAVTGWGMNYMPGSNDVEGSITYADGKKVDFYASSPIIPGVSPHIGFGEYINSQRITAHVLNNYETLSQHQKAELTDRKGQAGSDAKFYDVSRGTDYGSIRSLMINVR